MRLASITDIAPGAVLAQPVYGPTGLPLLHDGVALTREFIEMLRARQVASIWIEDADTADIELPMPISPQLRAKVTARMGGAFSNMAARTEGLRADCVAVARREMKSARFADAIRSAVGDGGLHAIAGDMDSMLDELHGQQVLTGLNSIKSHDAYTFQHSIDVTIMGLVLARSMNWERWRLRAFGIGCMLHDIGKLFIDPQLLNKAGRLTDAEFALMKAHPTVGYDAIKVLADHFGVLAPQVALQHHERQDGTGYPRRLRGSNALGRNEPGLIHDFGSIAAVADVYDAMTSARPYRAGWSPARTLGMIREGAGTHFNRQAVQIMLAAVPPYPVYAEVQVRTGKYAGWRGVVSAVSRLDLARPTVRLLHNSEGARVEPVEVDLGKERDVEIEPAPTTPIRAAA